MRRLFNPWLGVGAVLAILAAYGAAQYAPSRGGTSAQVSGTIALEPGTEVGIALGQEIGLTPGTSVELGATSLAALTTPVCGTKYHLRYQVTTSGPFLIPPDGGVPDRSSITVRNVSSSASGVCTSEPIDAGYTLDCANGSLGQIIFAQGGEFIYPVRETNPIYCRGCSGNTLLEFYEVSACMAP
jgi:hypothetical protein